MAHRRTRPVYQDVQLVFGLHGFTHLGLSLLAGGYTSGALTAPLVVLPQWWWARRRLRAAGVADTARLWRGLIILGSWLALAHATGAWLAPQAGSR